MATPATGNPREFYPYLLGPTPPPLRHDTYLPVDALPIALNDDGEVEAWLWWSDDEPAAACFDIKAPGTYFTEAQINPQRWNESIKRRVETLGMTPSQAAMTTVMDGVDPAPEYKRSAGRPLTLEPERMTYVELLRRTNRLGYFDRRGPMSEDMQFAPSGPMYQPVLPVQERLTRPINVVAHERDHQRVGFHWWSDEHDAVGFALDWLVPAARFSREGQAMAPEPQYLSPFRRSLGASKAEGLLPSEAIIRIQHQLPDERGFSIPNFPGFQLPSLAALDALSGLLAYRAAKQRWTTAHTAAQEQFATRRSAYFQLHPDEVFPL